MVRPQVPTPGGAGSIPGSSLLIFATARISIPGSSVLIFATARMVKE
jgi:hypothetical protein